MLLKVMQVFVMLKLNFLNPELQLKDTKPTIKKKLNTLLSELKGFKFVITLVL